MIHTYFVITQSLDPIHDRQINMIAHIFCRHPIWIQSSRFPCMCKLNQAYKLLPFKRTSGNFYLLNKPEFHVISDIIINFII